jgi:hypothetical protein
VDDCLLRPAVLQTLCRAVRTSTLRNISIWQNRIPVSGSVALALMVRVYPDVVPTPPSPAPSGTPAPSASSRRGICCLHAAGWASWRGWWMPSMWYEWAWACNRRRARYVLRVRRLVPSPASPLSPSSQLIPIIAPSTQGEATNSPESNLGKSTALDTVQRQVKPDWATFQKYAKTNAAITTKVRFPKHHNFTVHWRLSIRSLGTSHRRCGTSSFLNFQRRMQASMAIGRVVPLLM